MNRIAICVFSFLLIMACSKEERDPSCFEQMEFQNSVFTPISSFVPDTIKFDRIYNNFFPYACNGIGDQFTYVNTRSDTNQLVLLNVEKNLTLSTFDISGPLSETFEFSYFDINNRTKYRLQFVINQSDHSRLHVLVFIKENFECSEIIFPEDIRINGSTNGDSEFPDIPFSNVHSFCNSLFYTGDFGIVAFDDIEGVRWTLVN